MKNKKNILLGVWLLLLGGLFFGIQKLGSITPPQPPIDGKLPGPPPFDLAKVKAAWPQIQAHASAPPLGPKETPYTVIEFGDFECPPCGLTRPRLEKMLKGLGGKANLIFVNCPIRSHPYAIPAAEASLVAAAQGKFWPMYDTLYTNQENLEPGYYGDYAAKIGLNKIQFQKTFETHQYKAQVADSSKFCTSLGINSTPTVALRDNATGNIKIIPYGQGGKTLFAFLEKPDFTVPAVPAPKQASAQ